MPTAKCIKICQIFIICINLCDRELPSGQLSVVSRQLSVVSCQHYRIYRATLPLTESKNTTDNSRKKPRTERRR